MSADSKPQVNHARFPERVKAAAININGLTFWLPPPHRHHHIIRSLSTLGLPWPIKGSQGFIDHQNSYISRQQAAQLVGMELENGQYPELYSEDLW